MAFKARFSGKCRECGGAIEAGQSIQWDRTKRVGPDGRKVSSVYHADCKNPWGIPESAIARDTETLPPMPDRIAASIPPDMAEAVKAMLSALIAMPKAPAAVPEPTEPEESDYDAGEPTEGMAHPGGVVRVKPVPESVPVPSVSKSKLRDASTWYEVFAHVLPHVNRVLIIGPPSTGKSTTAILTGKIAARITMTETTSREDLIGMFHLIKGETKWIDGPVTCALREGKPVLIDEIDRYSPECASLLYSLIDDKPHVSLPTGELVTAADGYKVIMTSNEGLDTLPVAVQDRIEVILIARTPHADALAGLPTAEADVVMRYYRSLPIPAVKLPPSVRRIRAFRKLVNAAVPSKIAASLVFGEQGSREVLSTITSAEGSK